MVNLGLLLAVTLVYSIVSSVVAAFTVAQDIPTGFVLYGWLLTTYLLFPGTVLYLVLLELLPTDRSNHVRRGIAIALSPLVAAGLWFYFLPTGELLAEWRLAFFTPLVYAVMVRVRASA